MKFMCYWGDGYFPAGSELIELKELDFFCEDVGYSADDMYEITHLDEGETWKGEELSGVHYVTRVE